MTTIQPGADIRIDLEYRSFADGVELRRAAGGRLTAHGYAYRFRDVSVDLGGFVEQIRPGAAKRSIAEGGVISAFNHDPSFLLGRQSAGTLRLEEDRDGLAYEVDLPDTSAGRDVAALLERGDLAGSSFAFKMLKEDWSKHDGRQLRSVVEMALFEVGPVVRPAYGASSASLAGVAPKLSVVGGGQRSEEPPYGRQHCNPEWGDLSPKGSNLRPGISWLYS